MRTVLCLVCRWRHQICVVRKSLLTTLNRILADIDPVTFGFQITTANVSCSPYTPPPHPPNPQTTGFHHVLQPKHCNTILPLLNRVGQGFRKVAVSLLDMIKWSLTWILSSLVGQIDLTTTFGSKNSDVLIKKKKKKVSWYLYNPQEKNKNKRNYDCYFVVLEA